MPPLTDLLQRDLEALLDAIRRVDDHSWEQGDGRVIDDARRWDEVLERRDRVCQSYVLARARVAAPERGR